MRQTDSLDPSRANALNAVLGRERQILAGDPLLPFYHQVYFWDAQPANKLGRDGHPQVGQGVIPDVGLPRRMWAGGHLTFIKPLVAGVPAEKRSTCLDVVHKTGRTGPLAFVTLQHDIWQDGAQCLREQQDLVYRADATPTDKKPGPQMVAETPDDQRTVTFDSTMLFRYSALTFNGHRIHYDLAYAQDVEGYDNLVVHGPLLAQMLMLFALDSTGPLDQFKFRGAAPLTLGRRAVMCRKGRDFWVQTEEGHLIMRAEI